jgi:hypothetical protein
MDGKNTLGAPIPGAGLTVAYTGTAGTTAALSVRATVVRVVATTDCFIEIGAAPTAVANTSLFLPAGVPEYFACTAGDKVSAIQVSAAGSIYVTPFA